MAAQDAMQFHDPICLGTRVVMDRANAELVTVQAGMPYGTQQPTGSFGGDNSWQHATKNNPSKKRFTSYDRSDATGLDYAVNRYYSAAQGRFTQVDPIGAGASTVENPQTLNLYAYCGNDPINRTDPAGLFWGGLFKWIGKGLKWLGIAVAVAAVIVGGPFAPAATNILGKILGALIGFGAKIGFAANFLSGGVLLAEGASAAATLGAAVLFGAEAAVGAVSAALQKREQSAQQANEVPKKVCDWVLSKVTFYDSPKKKGAISGKKPVEGVTVAGDPESFGVEYPRGKQQTAQDVKTVMESQKKLKEANIIIQFPDGFFGEGKSPWCTLQDVGGGVRGSHIDVYVNTGAVNNPGLGGKPAQDVPVKVYVPLDFPCPQAK